MHRVKNKDKYIQKNCASCWSFTKNQDISMFKPLLDSHPTPNLEDQPLFNILQGHNVHTKFCDNPSHCTKLEIRNTHKTHTTSSSIVKSQASVHDSKMNKYHVSSLKCQLRTLEDSLTCTLVKCDKTKVLIRTTFRLTWRVSIT